jgi:hypothetical protein
MEGKSDGTPFHGGGVVKGGVPPPTRALSSRLLTIFYLSAQPFLLALREFRAGAAVGAGKNQQRCLWCFYYAFSIKISKSQRGSRKWDLKMRTVGSQEKVVY